MKYHTAVLEANSTVRCPLPYQLAILVGFQTVIGASATSERLGSRSPLRRGLPSDLCVVAELVHRAASKRKRVMKVIGLKSLRQRSSSLSDA